MKKKYMATCKNIIFVLLLTCALFNNAFAQPYSWNNTQTRQKNFAAKIDSIAIYQDLINQESAKANYSANIAGMIAGGGVTGLGVLICYLAASSEPSVDKSQSHVEQFGEAMGDAVAVLMAEVLGALIASGGIAILIVNIVKYNNRKAHAIKRDEYQNALYRYEAKKYSTQFIITPVVNLLSGGGGINAVLQF